MLAVLLGIAAAWDVRRRRIPNELTVSIAVAGLVARALASGAPGAASGLAAALVAGVVLWPAWARGALGGADLKLAVGAGTWVGLSRLVPFALASAVAAGVVGAICYAASSREARQAMRTNLVQAALGMRVAPPLRSGGGRVSVPAGVAVAVGALFATMRGG
ncbi:MAG TPA: A24 family peptidase [Anaeromyxobacter sp.]